MAYSVFAPRMFVVLPDLISPRPRLEGSWAPFATPLSMHRRSFRCFLESRNRPDRYSRLISLPAAWPDVPESFNFFGPVQPVQLRQDSSFSSSYSCSLRLHRAPDSARASRNGRLDLLLESRFHLSSQTNAGHLLTMSTPNALASSSKPSSAAKDPSKKSKKHKEHKEHKAHKSHKEDKDGKHHKKSGRDKESGQDKSKVKSSSSRHAEKDGKGKEKKGPFELHTSRMRLSVPPKYSGDWMAGVRELLDGMVMR